MQHWGWKHKCKLVCGGCAYTMRLLIKNSFHFQLSSCLNITNQLRLFNMAGCTGYAGQLHSLTQRLKGQRIWKSESESCRLALSYSREVDEADRMKVWKASDGWSISAYNGSFGTSSGDSFCRFTVNALGDCFHNYNPVQWCTARCYRLLYGLFMLLFLVNITEMLLPGSYGFSNSKFMIQLAD